MDIALMIVGGLIFFGSIIFAAINMSRQVKKMFDNDATEAFTGFGGMFSRHMGAVIGTMIGVAIFGIGLLMLIF